jgi:hypothetical protein
MCIRWLSTLTNLPSGVGAGEAEGCCADDNAGSNRIQDTNAPWRINLRNIPWLSPSEGDVQISHLTLEFSGEPLIQPSMKTTLCVESAAMSCWAARWV